MLFVEHYGEQKVLEALIKRNVLISPKEISVLGKKFILYLARAHKEKETELKGLIQRNGGYVAHLDGTCDGASPHFFCAVEEQLKLVLLSRKIPSESAEAIIPILRDLEAAYGRPLGIVCDMSKAIISAIEEVFPGLAIFICHFHFLRDLGKDLFKKEYDLLATSFRDFNVKTTLSKFARDLRNLIHCYPVLSKHLDRSADTIFDQQLPEEVLAHFLIEWIQNYPNDLDGYGFPFDCAHLALANRMKGAYEHLQKLDLRSNDRLMKIKEFLEEILDNVNIQNCIQKLESKVIHFNQLRIIMRLAPIDGKKGLNDDGENVNMSEMEKELEKFTALKEIKKAGLIDLGYKKMLAQIAKYKKRLFTNGIDVIDTEGNKQHIQPERTNNLLERFFREEKRGVRKKTGCKSVSRAFKTMLAETPYVKNLDNPEYMKVILNGKATLAARFAEIDGEQVRKATQNLPEDQDRLRPCVKKAIKNQNLLQSIVEAYLKTA